jgi:hypothetical protein
MMVIQLSHDVEQVACMTHKFAADGNLRPPAISGRNAVKKNLRLRCHHEECTHEGTFARHYELSRHIRTKHGDKKRFVCFFPGCYKRTRPTSFAREDKLVSHFRTVHGRQSEKLLHCPIQGCTRYPLTLDFLGPHVWQAHCNQGQLPESIRSFDEKARAIINATSTAYIQCPLWRCTTPVALLYFMQHITAHSAAELQEAASELRTRGYLLCHEGHAHYRCDGEYINTLTTHSYERLSVQACCPMCSGTFHNLEALQDHIDEEHLVAEDQKEHFRDWREYSRRTEMFRPTCTFSPWQRWVSANILNLKCPSCEHSQQRTHRTSDHQTFMLADPEGIKPYRRDILKLYPQFASHPVWKDLANLPSP